MVADFFEGISAYFLQNSVPLQTERKIINNMDETNKTTTLKDIVSNEDATSENVKQSEIVTLRQKIDEKKDEIERLQIANQKKKTAIIWLSILLGLCLIGYIVGGVYMYTNGFDFSFSPSDTMTETLSETATTKDEILEKANKNDSQAQLLMAQRYYNGTEGYQVDKEQALEWFTRSANNGNLEAMKLLATMYETGDGTEKNLQSAFKYYFTATRQKDKEALYKVGKFYYYGTAVEQNTEKALLYLNQAAEQDYQPAKTLVNLIKEQNTSTTTTKENNSTSKNDTTKH